MSDFGKPPLPPPSYTERYEEGRHLEEQDVREKSEPFYLVDMHMQSVDDVGQGSMSIKYIVDKRGAIWHMRNPNYYMPYYNHCSVVNLDFTIYDDNGVPHTVKLIDGYLKTIPMNETLVVITVSKRFGPPPDSTSMDSIKNQF